MSEWLTITLALIGVATGIFSLITVGISIGLLKATVSQLDVSVSALKESLQCYVTKDAFGGLAERAREDRIKNEEQHKTFYALENSFISFSQDVKNLDKRLMHLEQGITELLKRSQRDD
jgi:hypothetical protein